MIALTKYVVTFGTDIYRLREEYEEEIPDISYYALCDWLQEQLRLQFPRYVIIPIVEDQRDGETFSVRMVVDSPFEPIVKAKYFEVLEIVPYETVYGEEGPDS